MIFHYTETIDRKLFSKMRGTMHNLDYFIHLSRVSMAYWGIVTVVLLIIFFVLFLREPRRLLNGTTFSIFVLALLAELALMIFSTGNLQFIFIMGVIFIILMVIILLILALAWVLLLWNAIVVWRRESHTMSNMLTLVLAFVLLIIWVANFFVADHSQFLPPWLNVFLSNIPLLGIYLSFAAFNFLISDWLYQFTPRRYRDDYLIVLGAGLIDGDKVSRLLGSRIDRAIAYSDKQIKKGRPAPKIIFSGGQGPDEKLSEASAMSKYAIDHGLDPEQVLLENQSRNTYQNMTFSKKLILAEHADEDYRVKFFSNNYHIFRAGLYARLAGLKANGIGSKTKFYFLPNALIREFIAVFLMHKKRHFILMSLILVVILGLTFFSMYNGMQPHFK